MNDTVGSRLRRWGAIGLIGLLYYISARIGLALADPALWVSPFWPPSGLLLAALILNPPRNWPALLAVTAAATVAAHVAIDSAPGLIVFFALANALESTLAAFLLLRLRPGILTLGSFRDVLLFVVVSVVVSGLIGVFVALIGSLLAGLPFLRVLQVWWSANGLGMLVVGSCLITWAASDPDDQSPAIASRGTELAFALLALAAVAGMSLGPLPLSPLNPTPYLTFPVLLWVAARLGPRGASLATLLLTVLTIWATLSEHGWFVELIGDPSRRVLEMQIFLLIGSFSALALAAVTSERRKATRALVQARASLEASVAERTAALLLANEKLRCEIVERVATEAALRESQAQLGQALRLARSFTFQWDRGSDAVIRSADCGEILGLAGDAAIYDTGRGFFARVHRDDLALLVAAAGACTPANPGYRILYRFVRPDGSIVILEETAQAIFDAGGRYVRLFGISSDVTARERAAQRAAQLQVITAGLLAARTAVQVATIIVEQGLSALEATAGSVFSLAGDCLQLLSASGYSAEQMRDWERVPLSIESPATEAIRSGEPVWISSREAFRQRYPALTMSSTQHQSFVALPLQGDGQCLGVMTLSFLKSRLFSREERGHMLTLTGLCAQALERARLFEAEQQAHVAAEAAVLLRDQFLSIAAHELRTPLTVLFGTAQLMQRRGSRAGGLDEREERALTAITGQARRLDRLITMLLDISRIERGQLELERGPLDLIALLTRLVDEIQPMLSNHLVRLHAPATPLNLVGDDLRLEQLFQNLIHNAVKYSPEGGEVLVEIQAHDGAAVVHVRDRGIGIPSGELSDLFGRFFRASNSRKRQISGMGIGLYVAREIVERHGGVLSVFSVEGQGSTFTVRLPLP